jgi:ribonuclease P protein component
MWRSVGYHETYLATQAHTAQTRTWLHEAHVDPQRSARSQSTPRQRALEINCLIVALSRALRLRKNRDFQRVRQQGRSVSSRLLIVAWSPNDEGQLRIGFVVSKRIAKHAVVRNYVKRLLSEALRASLPGLPTGVDIVISARHAAIGADLRTLQQDISILLHRAKLL